jgi:hypothetical protein
MTKILSYKCNFCGHRTIDELIGVSWATKNTLVFVDAHATENHLCTTCLNAIRAIVLVGEAVVEIKSKGTDK